MTNERSERDTVFVEELRALLNKHSREDDSNTPDFILAEYLLRCLNVFNWEANRRTKWYESPDKEEPC